MKDETDGGAAQCGQLLLAVSGDLLAEEAIAAARGTVEQPQVPNYGSPKRGPRLLEGMTLAIEPMITLGAPATRTLGDKWTVVTADGSLAAHFEHTVAVTANGPRVLTQE